MITLRRAEQRHHARSSERSAWLTFHTEDRTDALAGGFGSLQILDENHLRPGAGITGRPHPDAETITYVRAGTLAYQDSTGHSARSGILRAGEFQRVSCRRGARQVETNPSRTDSAQVFKLRLRPPEVAAERGREQKRFSCADRRGVLCVIASPDARTGSLRIRQDAVIFSAILDPGQHLVHELAAGRSAWLHIVHGSVLFGDVVLASGDGAGVTAEHVVALTAREESEILLVDLRSEAGAKAGG